MSFFQQTDWLLNTLWFLDSTCWIFVTSSHSFLSLQPSLICRSDRRFLFKMHFSHVAGVLALSLLTAVPYNAVQGFDLQGLRGRFVVSYSIISPLDYHC